MAKAGAQAEQLRSSFDRLAVGVGQNGQQMLQAMRSASRGMVSDSDLILSANKAMLLGVADSGEELGQLLEVARVRGQAMGLTLTQAFNDIVTGIGRMSPLILDNLGIVTGGQKVFDDYARAIGRSADSLTDAEKKQALLNKVVAESSDMVAALSVEALSPAESFERMNAAIQNAKDALGVLFSPAIAAIAQELADAVSAVTDELTESRKAAAESDLWRLGDAITANIQAQEEAVQRMQFWNELDAHGDTIRGFAQQLDMLRGASVALGEEYNKAAAALGAPLLDLGALESGIVQFQSITDNVRNLGDEALNTADDIDEIGKAIDRLQSDFSSIERSLVRSSLNLAETIGTDQAREVYEQQMRILDAYREGNHLTEAANQNLFEQGLFIQRVEGDVVGLVDNLVDATTETKRLSSAASTVQKEFDKVTGIASGIISGAIGPVAGVDAEDLLPREDAVNENARRLADIAVNGLNPMAQWFDEFKREAPLAFWQVTEAADPKAAAARILKDFQDGLRPDLIDKGKAAELVERAFRADQAMKQLVDEVAAEAAQWLNIGLSEAKTVAEKALGVSTTQEVNVTPVVTPVTVTDILPAEVLTVTVQPLSLIHI